MNKLKNKNVKLIVFSEYAAIERDLPYQPQPVTWWVDWLEYHRSDILHLLQWQKCPIELHEGPIYYEVSFDNKGNIDGFIPKENEHGHQT